VLTDQRWRRVARLFEQARELLPAERARLLDAPDIDSDVRDEVRSLLHYDQSGAEVPGPDLASGAAALAGLTSEFTPGARIASYTLVRSVGRGASGCVYEALQDQPSRTVALKILQAPVASPESIRRFRDESAALARLRHPGIAQVFEAGTARLGATECAFVALEFVPNARPITEAGASLSLRDRVLLIVRVCEAVHHAHLRGVIHRDIKPANILVADEVDSPPLGRGAPAVPQPKVIDFGVARLMDHARCEGEATLPGQLIGTLHYMAPEQAAASADGADVRADVYSLGVVLYRVLCGRHPYELPSNAVAALRTIADAVPPPPSALEQSIDRDLDRVVHTALAKQREHRYQSAAALAEDLRRWLERRPIVARPPSLTRRGFLLARRNPVAAALLALLVVAIASGIGVGVAGAIETARQRSAAEAVTAYITNMFASPTVGTEGVNVRVVDVLDNAVAGLSGLNDRPDVQTGIRRALANSYEKLGAYAKARDQFEIVLNETRRRFGDSDDRTIDAMFDLSGPCFDLGDYARAEELLQPVLEYRIRHHGPHSPPVAETLNDLALIMIDTNRSDEAEPMFRRALAIWQTDPASELNVSRALFNIGVLRRRARDSADAARCFEQAALIQERLNGPDDRDLASTRRHHALALMDMGQLDRAQALADNALAVVTRTLGDRHPSTAGALVALARIRQRAGDAIAAENLFVRAIDIYREVHGPDHLYTRQTSDELRSLRAAAGQESGDSDEMAVKP
jgi:serine/threonine protein kinase